MTAVQRLQKFNAAESMTAVDPSATFAISDWSPHSGRYRADMQTAKGRA